MTSYRHAPLRPPEVPVGRDPMSFREYLVRGTAWTIASVGGVPVLASLPTEWFFPTFCTYVLTVFVVLPYLLWRRAFRRE